MVQQPFQPGISRSVVAPRRLPLVLLALLLTVPVLAADPVEQLSFGTEMASRGLWSEALFRFRQAEKSNPDDARILNNIAVSLEALGLYEEALDTYRQAVEAGPSLELAKRNYARFVEFYQAYRGGEVEEEDDSAEATDQAEGAEATTEAADDDQPVDVNDADDIEEASDGDSAGEVPAGEEDEV